jgi:hypothetical protein
MHIGFDPENLIRWLASEKVKTRIKKINILITSDLELSLGRHADEA